MFSCVACLCFGSGIFYFVDFQAFMFLGKNILKIFPKKFAHSKFIFEYLPIKNAERQLLKIKKLLKDEIF